MPTLAGLLGAVDSVVTPAKRKLADLLANPVDSWQQMQGGLLDDTRRLDALYKTAGDGRRLDAQGSVMGGLPQYKQAQQQQLSGLLNVMPVGATVWHGSPHKFDKFDASKIGTGEGAQAYGHGLYFAEAPDVAREYAANVSTAKRKIFDNSGLFVNGKKIDPLDPMANMYSEIADKGAQRAINDRVADIQKLIETKGENYTLAKIKKQSLEKMKSLISEGNDVKRITDVSVHQPEPLLYKVDLPDEHIAKMLDWDKPLSQQAPHVKNALLNSGDKTIANAINDVPVAVNGGEYWKYRGNTYATKAEALQDAAGFEITSGRTGLGNTPAEVSNRLKDLGIPGIRYLDQGSRDAGKGTSNFVVFPGNEGILSILERNGIPLK